MPDGTLTPAPEPSNRRDDADPPPVHGEARLVPTEAFRRCQAKLNDPRILHGKPDRLDQPGACQCCGAPGNWQAVLQAAFDTWPELSGPLDAEDAL